MNKKLLFVLVNLGLFGAFVMTESQKKPLDSKPKKIITKSTPPTKFEFYQRLNEDQKIKRNIASSTPIAITSKSFFPHLDDYQRVDLPLEGLSLIPDIHGSLRELTNDRSIAKVAGMFFYESRGQDKSNIVFDKGRGQYALWSGLIILDADHDLGTKIEQNFGIKIQETMGLTHFYQTDNNFDLQSSLKTIINTPGVNNVRLDLLYSKIQQK